MELKKTLLTNDLICLWFGVSMLILVGNSLAAPAALDVQESVKLIENNLRVTTETPQTTEAVPNEIDPKSDESDEDMETAQTLFLACGWPWLKWGPWKYETPCLQPYLSLWSMINPFARPQQQESIEYQAENPGQYLTNQEFLIDPRGLDSNSYRGRRDILQDERTADVKTKQDDDIKPRFVDATSYFTATNFNKANFPVEKREDSLTDAASYFEATNFNQLVKL